MTEQKEITVKVFGNTEELASDLLGLQGHQFMSIKTRIPMDGKMNKTNNPFYGKGVCKFANTQVATNFKSYYDKVENRDGAKAATKGNWQTACIFSGHITPMTVHKGDVVTELTTDPDRAKLDDNGQIKDCVGNHRAILNEHGNIQFTTATDRREYIRAECLRKQGDKPRQERELLSKSKYYNADGTEIEKSKIEPYLKKRQPRTDETDFQTFALKNILELRAGGIVWQARKSNLDELLAKVPSQSKAVAV